MKSVQLYMCSLLVTALVVLAGCGQVQQESSQIADEPSLSKPIQSLAVGDLAWVRQFGTSGNDIAKAVAGDATGVYVAGHTEGIFSGGSNWPGSAYMRKYDFAGNELWTRQFGTPEIEEVTGVSTHPTGIYVVGSTVGTLPGQIKEGVFWDAFIRKYDSSGNEVWTRQFGSSATDYASAVCSDARGVYMVGTTFGTLPGQTSAGALDFFVRKYDFGGNVIWTRQWGTLYDDWGHAVSSDASGVYVVGRTEGTLEGQTAVGDWDAYVRKYDPSGNVVWTRQFGTSAYDGASAVAVNPTGVYVAGTTSGTLAGQTPVGSWDAFVRKYDSGGHLVWTKQFGTPEYDGALGISSDPTGVYVVGSTSGTFARQTHVGNTDIYVRKYDWGGNEAWTKQFGIGTPDYAGASAITSHTTGVYVAGSVYGTFPGQTWAGDSDAFLINLVSTPVPSVLGVLNFFDNAVAGGTLVGSGPGNSAGGRLKALRNMLFQAKAQFEAGHTSAACQLLRDAYKHADGQPRPPDFVAGSAAQVLAQMIQSIIGQACSAP